MGEGVLQVVTSTDRRGAEVFALDLQRALEDRGVSTSTVALAPGRSGGLGVESLGQQPRSPTTLRALRRRGREAAVVVAHGSTTLSACALGLAGSGVPFVYRNIGDPEFWATSAGRRLRLRAFLRRAAHVVAVSPRAASTLIDDLGLGSTDVTVIPTGASASRFTPATAADRAAARERLGLHPQVPIVAVVSALSAEKDVGLAIDAAARLPGVHVVIAGDGPEGAALRARADGAAPGRVTFLGSVAEVVPVYAAADVVALTSRTEGLPAVVIEAGLAGLPVVATDVGYVADVVVDGSTGLLVPPGDEDALATAIDQAMHDGGALGRAARERCAVEFELGRIADRWHAVLRATGVE